MPRFIKSYYFALATALLLLSGCSTLPTQEYQPIEVTNTQEANNWELQGKIAFKSSTDKFSTNLYWFHHLQGNELRLTTPLGTNVLTLKNIQGLATLEVEGKTYHDNDAQALLEGISGITIPFSDIPLWLTGRVGKNDKVISYDSLGQIKQFSSPDAQSDWKVSFINWQQQSGTLVPRQLKIERDDIQIKIQTNLWQALTPK
ncbi:MULTISPECIES: lipoprotein insertase outer membrane protein LolB [Pseudomonadati]|uniref:Outer-membrane lipoprotein LolB n=1 Tax=Shewanella aestuarii TaxID=1028752 RepID=A0ABT0L0D3_9GAMM|nr:lipoprotein insertase outer membrane protein LolB [Shewanella aestuarii]MCL1117150.1 lipoprotein insertase outer membrane protein LolB [Shewanella aestuarii]GGN73834.1 outer-membrane lipoprotein LolB [Shewanella aestuarii]